MTFNYCQNCGVSFAYPKHRYDIESHCLCKNCRTGNKCRDCGSCIGSKKEEDQAVVREEVTEPSCVNPYCNTEQVTQQ